MSSRDSRPVRLAPQRLGKDGRYCARPELIAGVPGLGFDTLQRGDPAGTRGRTIQVPGLHQLQPRATSSGPSGCTRRSRPIACRSTSSGAQTEFGPVPERFAPVFRDRDELATATNLGETLTRALQQSAFQIVICSPKAAANSTLGQRGDPRLQAPRPRAPHFLPDRRRRAGFLGERRHGRPGVLSERADLQDGCGRPADGRHAASRSPRTRARARTASTTSSSSCSPACSASASTN